MCNQREKTLDHLYSTHRDAYKSPPRPKFDKSDHNVNLLIPAYKQKLNQEASVTQSIKRWSVKQMLSYRTILLVQTGKCSGILPMTLRSTPHQSLASSISESMTFLAHINTIIPRPTSICIPQIHR